MFIPGSWFFIDAENRRVPQVAAATLPQALDLIGRGKITAVVGRLRPEFHVIDIDLEGWRGDAAADYILTQLARQGWWHLVRPSGGGQGRHHVFVHSASHLDELNALVTTTRTQFKAARSKIDLRTSVRPLCSPHRHGGHTRPLGQLPAAYGTLLALIEHLPTPRRARPPKPRGKPRGWQYSSEAPLTPRPRPRRELEAKWRTYLATGRKPAWARASEPGIDSSGSTYELMCTAAMLRAGWTCEESWAQITRAHPQAMPHARRESPQRWITHVWNAAVRADANFVPTPRIDADVWAATEQARQRIRSVAWSLPVRQRTSFLCVAWTVLRRMEAANTLRVPVPERDLVLDTGLRDRATIRAALRRMDASVGALHRDCLDPSDKSGSSYEFSIPSAQGRVSENPPPSFHTPLRTQLPAELTPIHWLTLATLHPSRPLTSSQLCTLLQRTPSPAAAAADHTVRHQLQLLTDLQACGLASCDETGSWTRPADLLDVAPRRHADHGPLTERIAAERTRWRTGTLSMWSVCRAAAIAHTRQTAQQWWAQLDSQEQTARTTRLGQVFDEQSPHEQHALKRRLHARDQAAGLNPGVRRRLWWQSLNAGEQQRRREQRLERWHRLPHAQQVALARLWEAERRELGEGEVRPWPPGQVLLPAWKRS